MPQQPTSIQSRSRLIVSAALCATAALITVVLNADAAPARSSKPAPARKPAPPKTTPPNPQSAIRNPQSDELFEKKVRPVLLESCGGCHSASTKSPMGGLVLDTRAGFLKGGKRGPVVVPGNPDKSLLIRVMEHAEPGLAMPPSGKVAPEKIQALREWVKLGAVWPEHAGAGKPQSAADHWSFQPLKRPAVPAIRNPQSAIRNPIDSFVLQKLQAKGLSPAPPADRRTLIRRLTYDLTGLPPTPEEVDAFLKDTSPNAYEKVVDRLFASPAYGERWARHWLDLVRFAETDGHEFDFEKPGAWEYRDYVIRALNADVPYNQFVLEHVAGDLLPEPRRHPTERFNESIIGTGFWWLGEGKHSPVDLREDEAERVDNQIDVFSKTFFGLSAGCAKCHDHKFDPIPTKDYYALAGYMQSTRYHYAAVDDPKRLQKAAAEVEALNQKIRPALLAETLKQRRAVLSRLADSLLAARDVMAPDGIPVPEPAEPDQLFEGFEGETYGSWTVTGSAFGEGPNRKPTPEYQGELNARGAGFVNTHSARLKGERAVGDKLTGTLTSPAFTITRPYIRFLVGGGSHAGKTCMDLVVDGKAVRTVTGKDDNRMAPGEWDVRDLIGKQAQIRIVDEVTGPWGNIGVDEIVFSSAEGPERRRLAEAARRHRLEPTRLGAWVRYLRDRAAKDPADPFHAWALLAAEPRDRFEARRREVLAALKAAATKAEEQAKGWTVYQDFTGESYGDWFVTGQAFGAGPARELVVRESGGRVEGVMTGGVADSARISDRLEGTLRSQTFTISKPWMLFRMAGRASKVNLIIDGFQRIRNPIYGGLTIDLKNGGPLSWHSIDLKKWVGHTAYLEFLDFGDGYITVDEVVFSDTPPPAAPSVAVLRALSHDAELNPEALAGRLQAEFEATAPEQFETLGWALARNVLPVAGGAVTAESCGGEMPALIEQRKEAETGIPSLRRVPAMVDGTGENERIHIRGSHKSLGEEAPRRLLTIVAGESQPEPKEGSGRLEMARRMLASPLLARVIVNRVWQHHFTEGIVRTPDDFGTRGERPTHPELLEWLASWFVTGDERGEEGARWSLKRLHKLIVTSDTYRQSSTPKVPANPQSAIRNPQSVDPTNALLHRQNVRRLEAEAIRDGILAVSGRLDRKMYGEGVLPYLTPFMIGRGRPEKTGPVDGAGRRSIYLNVRRNFLTPMFLAFDYPIPFNTIGRRSVSTVPAQALTLMNNPFVVEQAGVWAKRVLAEGGSDARARIGRMYEQAYARPPSETEVGAALAFLEEQGRKYDKPDDERAWRDLAHVLINVKEFIFVR